MSSRKRGNKKTGDSGDVGSRLSSLIESQLILFLSGCSLDDEVEFIIGKPDTRAELFRNSRNYYITEYSGSVSYFEQNDTELIVEGSSNNVKYRRRISGKVTTFERKVIQDSHSFEEYGIKLNKKSEFEDKPSSYTLGVRRIKSVTKVYTRLYSIYFSEVTTIRSSSNRKKTYEIELELNPLAYSVIVSRISDISNAVIFLHSIYNSLSFYSPTMPLSPTLLEIEENKRHLDDYVPREVVLRDIESSDLTYGNIIGGEYSYKVGIKNDGTRAYLICDKTGIWISSRSFNQLKYRWTRSDSYDGTITIFDGELMLGCTLPPCVKYQEGNYEYYVIFDCLVSFSRNISGRPMSTRLTEMDYSGDMSSSISYDSGIPGLLKTINDKVGSYAPNGLFIHKKTYRSLVYVDQSPMEFEKRDGFFDVVKGMLEKDKEPGNNSDGIIFFPDSPFFLIDKTSKNIGEKPAALKWKTIENRTIDLYCSNKGGIPTLYATDYKFPDRLRPVYDYSVGGVNISSPRYNGVIIEFKVTDKTLTYVRERLYKPRPNSYHLLERITSNSITEDDLLGNSIYLVSKLFNRIKRGLLDSADGKSLLDLGSGRLGDIGKWTKFNTVVAVEPTDTSRFEGLKRLKNMNRKGIFVICLGAERYELVRRAHNFFTFNKRSDCCSMMLSMSNFSSSNDDVTVKDVCNTVRLCCKDKSDLHFLTIDGNKVSQQVREEGDKVEAEGIYTISYIDDTKYSINLPNTIIDYQEEEYYVNLSDYAKELRTKKIDKNYVVGRNSEPLLTQVLQSYCSFFSYGKIGNVSADNEPIKEDKSTGNPGIQYSKFESLSKSIFSLTGINDANIDKDRDINQFRSKHNVGIALSFYDSGKVIPFSHTLPGHTNISIVIVRSLYYSKIDDDIMSNLVGKENFYEMKNEIQYSLSKFPKDRFPHLKVYVNTGRTIIPKTGIVRELTAQMNSIEYFEETSFQDYLIWSNVTSHYMLKDFVGLYKGSVEKIVYTNEYLFDEGELEEFPDAKVEVYSSSSSKGGHHLGRYFPGKNVGYGTLIVTNKHIRDIDRDIPQIIRNKHSNPLTSLHWGQLKLLDSEIEFLSMFPETEKVIYVGASPGNHIPYLATLFPEKHFDLYDPSAFSMYYGESNRKITPKNISIFSERAEAGTFNKTDGSTSLFISDIRSFNPRSGASEDELNKLLLGDLELQMNIANGIRPVASLLKFKLPYGDGETDYFDGKIMLPVWGKQQTTETRLLVTDHKKKRKYNHKEYENRMNYFNKIHRYAYHKHKLVGKSNLCPCYDCASHVNILERYAGLKSKEIDYKVLEKMSNDCVYYCASGSGKTLTNPGEIRRHLTFNEILEVNDYQRTKDWLKNVRNIEEDWISRSKRYGNVSRALKEDPRVK